MISGFKSLKENVLQKDSAELDSLYDTLGQLKRVVTDLAIAEVDKIKNLQPIIEEMMTSGKNLETERILVQELKEIEKNQKKSKQHKEIKKVKKMLNEFEKKGYF